MAIKCGCCKGRHVAVVDVRACYAEAADAAAQSYGEIYAEAVASWVTSGGNPKDAHRYASVIARGEVWNGGLVELPDLGQCEHGLSLALCAGPGHYPMDSYDD